MVRAKTDKGVATHKVLLTTNETTVDLPGKLDWALLNEGGHGFYRVHDAPPLLEAITGRDDRDRRRGGSCGRRERQLVDRDRPGPAARRQHARERVQTALLELADRRPRRRHLGAAAQRERAAQRGHQARAGGDDQLVVGQRGPRAGADGPRGGVDARERVDVTADLLVAQQRVEVERRQLCFAQRLGDRDRAVEERLAGREHVDLQPPRHERAQREQRLECADSGARDDDARTERPPGRSGRRAWPGWIDGSFMGCPARAESVIAREIGQG